SIAIEAGPDLPPALEWRGTDALEIRATLGSGQSVLVQESFDPAWRAYSAGKTLPIRKDVFGFMLIDAPSGEHAIELVFKTPLENRIGMVVSCISVVAIMALAAFFRKT